MPPRVTSSSKRVTLHPGSPGPRANFAFSHIKGSLLFIKKCMKSSIAWGGSVRRVTLPLGTTLLQINRPLKFQNFEKCESVTFCMQFSRCINDRRFYAMALLHPSRKSSQMQNITVYYHFAFRVLRKKSVASSARRNSAEINIFVAVEDKLLYQRC